MPDLFLLETIKSAQAEHGLRHDDYERYRKYCTRRIYRLRATLNFRHGRGKKYEKRDDLVENLSKLDGCKRDNALVMVAFEAERQWAHALEQRATHESKNLADNAKVRHAVYVKMRRAMQFSMQLKQLAAGMTGLSQITLLDIEAYALWMQATAQFERGVEWKSTLDLLINCRSTYSRLAVMCHDNVEHEALCFSRIDDIDPSLRYCAFNLNMDSSLTAEQIANNGDVVSITANKSTQHQVRWAGQTIAVKNQKVFMSILKGRQARSHLATLDQESIEDAMQLQDDTLQAVNEALDLAKADLQSQNQAQAKVASSKSEATRQSLSYIVDFLHVLRFVCTVERDLRLASSMYHKLPNMFLKDIESTFPMIAFYDISAKFSVGDAVKPLDLARLFSDLHETAHDLASIETIFQDLNSHSTLQELESVFQGAKCVFLAMQMISEPNKAGDMVQLFDRATVHIRLAHSQASIPDADSDLSSVYALMGLPDSYSQILQWIESLKMVYVSNVVLGYNGVSETHAIQIPPKISPIPHKPVFYDLAYSKIMDSLPLSESRDTSSGKGDAMDVDVPKEPTGIIGKLGLGGWFGGR